MHPDLEKLISAGKLAAPVAEKLARLEPGTYCHHSSWGAGRVTSWDLPGDRVEVDFESKPGHELKLEFAARSLDPLPEGHFLARRFADRPALVEVAQKNPAGLVRLVLESHGGTILLDRFEEWVTPRLIPREKYKAWWESAKRALRADKSFVVPSKRNLPLEMRAAGLGHGEALVGDFLAAHDLKGKVKAAEAIAAELPAFSAPAEQLGPIAAGLDEAASKALRLQPALAFELLLVRDELFRQVPALRDTHTGGLALAAAMTQERRALPEVLKSLPISRTRELLAAYPAAFGDSWLDEALLRLADTSGRALQEVTALIIGNEKSEELVITLQTGIQNRTLSYDALQWICRERKGDAFEVFDSDFAPALLGALEREHYEESTRRSGRLRDLVVNDRELLGDLAVELDSSQAKTFARRLWASPVFDDLTRRSLLARIIKAVPEVQEVIEHPDSDHDHSDEVLVVSFPSFEQRQAAYDRLIKIEIPQNTKDLQVARSYGDLRENFEFKSAKEQQRVLMRRQRIMERELSKARTTDFKDAPTHVVSIGTIVTFGDDSGREEVVTILGAWDTDPDKGIVSYLSGLAKSLMGKAPGDACEIPTEDGGTRPAVVRSIRAFAG